MLFPILDSLRGKRLGDFRDDFLAGTVTATLLVPQTMGYSLIAGLPPQMGLYAAIVPTLIYAFTTSSRLTVVGPVAVQSVMIGAALAGSPAGSEVAGGVMIAVLSGFLLLALGLLRLGWLTNFISRPVLSGFIGGAATFIITAQLGSLIGVSVPREGAPITLIWNMLHKLNTANTGSGLFGAAALVALFFIRGPLAALLTRAGLRADVATFVGRSGPLVVVAIATIVSVWLEASRQLGVKVVGPLPRGLPEVSAAMFQYPEPLKLLPSAILIAIVGYVETVTITKTLAFRRRQTIDPNRELLALGFANLGAAGFGAMPVASGLTKSSANFDSGAQSEVSSIVAAAWVALCAAFFTGMLQELPRSVLSAVIVVAVWKLIDLPSFGHNWKFSKGDGVSQIATVIGVLVLGVEQGLVVGIAIAAALFLYRTSRADVVVLGRVPGSERYRSAKREDVETYDHLLLIRIDESLYYANTSRVETELQRLVVEHPKAGMVVLVLSGVGHIDASSLEMLEQFERALHAQNVRLMIAEAKNPLMEQLEGTLLLERIGHDHVFHSTHEAVASTQADYF